MSVQVSYKKQFLFGIMLLLVILIVVESATRVYDYYNPYCGLKNENIIYSNIDYSTKSKICESWLSLVWHWDEETDTYILEPNQHKETVNINNHGFRGPEFSIEKSEDVYRIFLVGGSTTASLRALSDEVTPAGYLKTKIDEMNREYKIEVINAGIPGFTSSQELKLIKNRILDLNPDLIIIYDGANDINYPYGFVPDRGSLRDVLSDFLNRYLFFWESIPIIYHIISQLTENSESKSFDDSTADFKAELWSSNMIQFCDLGKNHGFKTVVVLQPILGTGERDLTERERKQFEIFDHAKVVPAYQLFGNKLDDLKLHCNIVVDFRNIFDNIKGDIYFDNAHVGYQSNEIIAEKILEKIRQLVN